MNGQKQPSASSLFREAIVSHRLISAVFSGYRLAKGEKRKVSIRPVELKGRTLLQITVLQGTQAFHQNISPEDFLKQLEEDYLHSYRQIFLRCTDAEYQVLSNGKGIVTILKRPVAARRDTAHNRQKKHSFGEGTPWPFLVELGIMDPSGRLIASRAHKFRQINRFLEVMDTVLPSRLKAPLHVVDLGCGKAYLTFALYAYLKEVKQWPISAIGVDLKGEVLSSCQQLATKLGYTDLSFFTMDIGAFCPEKKVDLLLSLHACDTATDLALEKAVRWGVPLLLVAPCCQHELYGQIDNSALKPLLRHGILKERLAALATDAARAQLLEAVGYETQIFEFVDQEHTSKNLLLKGTWNPSPERQRQAWQAYLSLRETLSIRPALERLLEDLLPSD